MGPFYKRKSTRQLKFTKELLAEIAEKIKNGRSKRSVAREYNINESTLRKRLKLGTIPNSLGRFKSVFNSEKELELVERIRQLDELFYGLTVKGLRGLVYQFAEEIKVDHPFNKTTKLVGKKWIQTFCKKYNLSIRQPEKVSVARAIGFNKVQVTRFFENLERLIKKYSFSGKTIFNMDETGMLTVPNKIPKVISIKGKKNVGKVVSGERGQLITAVCCNNARGFYVPPALIYPRKREKKEFLYGAPEDTIMMLSDTGFINSDLFVKWLKHFQQHVKATIENPILLILDNHSSHISLEAIQFSRASGIHLLSLPPHASHKIQPLDVGFFGPLKTAYGQETDKWMTMNPGKIITIYEVAALFGKAYTRTASIEKAEKSFAATGIWPYNPQVFSDTDFAPASVTDSFPIENAEIIIEDEQVYQELLSNLPTTPTVLASADNGSSPHIGMYLNNCVNALDINQIIFSASPESTKNTESCSPLCDRSNTYSLPGPSGLCGKKGDKNKQANPREHLYYIPSEKNVSALRAIEKSDESIQDDGLDESDNKGR